MPSEFAIQALLALEDTCPLLHRSRAARNVARYLPATLLLSAGLIGVLGFADDIVVRWLDGVALRATTAFGGILAALGLAGLSATQRAVQQRLLTAVVGSLGDEQWACPESVPAPLRRALRDAHESVACQTRVLEQSRAQARSECTENAVYLAELSRQTEVLNEQTRSDAGEHVQNVHTLRDGLLSSLADIRACKFNVHANKYAAMLTEGSGDGSVLEAQKQLHTAISGAGESNLRQL
jgi:hypothetical protein